MKEVYLIFFFISGLYSVNSFCQVNSKDSTNLQFWQSCVLNLECVHHRFTPFQINQIVQRQIDTDSLHVVTQDSIEKLKGKLYFIFDTITGSGILVQDGPNKYIVTCNHLATEYWYMPRNNLNQISVRTNLNIFQKGKLNDSKIYNFQVATDAALTFEYSEDNDIAVISLQSIFNGQLAKTIEDDGYKAVPLNMIDTSSSNYIGDNICAIGFSNFFGLNPGKAEKFQTKAQSNQVVFPITTFGKIAMFEPSLNYFIGDITVYPGNSGGPVIKNNLLVGLVSEQVLNKLEADRDLYANASDHLYSRGELATITKSINIIPVIRELEKTEKAFNFH